MGADATHQLIVDDELGRAGVRRPTNTIGIGWAGPTILHAGTDAQKDRYLLPLLAGEEIWCQLFSEPGAGSDLASLTTRAYPDGDGWVVEGQKLWTSYAHVARFGILLARTEPEAPIHQGISYFVCPMDAPGVTVRPLTDMTGTHTFNEVFLDGVHLDGGSLIGRRGQGWSLAKVTLGNERVSLSGSGALWGMGPTAADLVDVVRTSGGLTDPVLRQRLAQVWAEGEILRLLRLRTVSAAVGGMEPGPEASVRKALADEHGQHVMTLARDLAGAGAMLRGAGPVTPAAGRRALCRRQLRRCRLGVRLSVRSGLDHRWRDRRGAAQHHRRAHAGTAARPAGLRGQTTMGPASSYPCLTPWPALRTSCSGSYSIQ